MAGYSIVLNLGGNAVSRAEKLAAALATANVNAASLATNLAAINAVSSKMPTRTIRVSTPRRPAVTPNENGVTNYTRHRSTRIASFGTGFNLGGFSGRLSTILQPDENGNLLGMNAAKLSKALNVTAIATNVMASIGKALLKITAYSTLAPLVVSGGIMLTAIKALQSESFAEGVRLISRRHMAKTSLGADYEQANKNADFLAASYGFDRSTTLSSINVLSGLGVGGQKRKISMGEATGLTKIGGLISQQSGAPFERVMTNIQQLLVQDKPNIRDIRELLNQAPILGKYALKEMESRNIKGVDTRSYLKDQSALLSVLKRYELDNASNAGMQARGQIGLATQDMWAKIAGNDKFWSFVGDSGSGIIGAIANGINGLMTALSENPAFKVMVKNLELTFDALGEKGGTFIDKLIALIDMVASKYGFDLGDKQKAKEKELIKAELREKKENEEVLFSYTRGF